MARLTWDTVGTRFYETGVDRGVLYIGNNPGVPWSGLVSVDESPSGGDAKSYYIDGIKRLNVSAEEEFEATISAFYSPPEFDVCDGLSVIRTGLLGAQQRRKSFGLSYRTKIGNDVDADNHAYKIHLIYNALAQPTQRKHSTIDTNAEAPLLDWSITTKPIFITGFGYTSHLIIDTTTAPPYSIQSIENVIYGDELNPPRLPTVSELLAIFEDVTPLTVTEIEPDLFTISGSGLKVWQLEPDLYQITSDSVVVIDADSATITSE